MIGALTGNVETGMTWIAYAIVIAAVVLRSWSK